MCACASVYVSARRSQQRVSDLSSCSYSCLWAPWHGRWTLNSGPLEKHPALLTPEPSPVQMLHFLVSWSHLPCSCPVAHCLLPCKISFCVLFNFGMWSSCFPRLVSSSWVQEILLLQFPEYLGFSIALLCLLFRKKKHMAVLRSHTIS